MDHLRDVVLCELRRHPDALEARVRDDHRVPIARGDARHQLAPAIAFQILLSGHEHRGLRIQAHELGRVLAEHVIRDHMAGLREEAQAPHLHARDHAHCRLAGADHVEQAHVAGLHDAPHRIPLVRVQREALREPRQLQVRTIEVPRPRRVEQVVVDPAQPLAAFVVLEGPGRETVLQRPQLLARRQRFRRIDDVAVLGGMCVPHRGHLHVERGLYQLDRVHAWRAPFLGHLHVLPRAPLGVGHRPGAGLCRIRHLAVLEFQHFVHEPLHVAGGDPHRAQARLDGRRLQVLGLHALQRLHVAAEGWARQRGLLELLLDVARQVLVGRFPGVVGRVQKDLPGLGQRGQHLLLGRRQQPRHVGRIDAAPPLHRRGQRLGRFCDRRRRRDPAQRALREQRCLAGAVRLFVVVLQRQQQRVVRVAPKRQRVGPGTQASVARHVAVVGPVEHGP